MNCSFLGKIFNTSYLPGAVLCTGDIAGHKIDSKIPEILELNHGDARQTMKTYIKKIITDYEKV